MTKFAGIIYPRFFRGKGLIQSMLPPVPKKDISFFRQQNIELGASSSSLCIDSQKRQALAYSGSVYNKTWLQKTLAKALPPEPSSSQILLAAYNLWGENCIQEIEGPCLLAIVDLKQEKLLLIRDRVGEEQLYWFQNSKYFLFATELPPLLATGQIPQSPALDGLATYFTLGYVPQDRTLVKQVNKLLPSHLLHYDLRDKLSVRPYFSFRSTLPAPTAVKETEIEELLDSSLEQCLAQSPSLRDLHIPFTPSPLFQKALEKRSLSLHSWSFKPLSYNQVNQFLVPMLWHGNDPLAHPHALALWLQWKQHTESEPSTVLWLPPLYPYFQSSFLQRPSPFSPPQSGALRKSRLYQKLLLFLARHSQCRLVYTRLRQNSVDPQHVAFFARQWIISPSLLSSLAPPLRHFFSTETLVQQVSSTVATPMNSSLMNSFSLQTQLVDESIALASLCAKTTQSSLLMPTMHKDVIQWFLENPVRKKSDKKQKPFPFLIPQAVRHELHSLFQRLHGGILTSEGFVSPSWIKKTLSQSVPSKEHFFALWSLLVLEIWMRLYLYKLPERYIQAYTVEEILDL